MPVFANQLAASAVQNRRMVWETPIVVAADDNVRSFRAGERTASKPLTQ
jgi:hypothetical protein